MYFRKHFPKLPLSNHVECLWYAEGAPGPHAKERLLPNGEAALIFNLCDEPVRIYDANDLSRFNSYGYAVLSGARTDCFVIDTSQEERVIGIQFRPGGAFPFFREPVSEMENDSFAVEDFWGAGAGSIREQLLAISDVDEMLLTLEKSLLQQLVRPLELHPAVSYALNCFEVAQYRRRVAAVIDSIGLSQRRFIQLFHEQVGLTPKAFCRVRRFQRVLRVIQNRGQIDWTQIALSCGYYDQSHFIHDFQGFSGLTPNAYAAVATPHLNHLKLQ
jgi:AraC-like DNA-binding protein